MKLFARILRDERGTTAIEMAILAPVFFLIIIGMVYVGLLMFTMGSMHYAVEAAARCASVETDICSNAASTESYAMSKYFGGYVTPDFTYAAETCGQSVSADATFVLDLGVRKISIPLSATACFP